MTTGVTIRITTEEAKSLRDKLTILLEEGQGVDVWLAPGGVLNVNDKDSDTECFLDVDEPASDHLASVLDQLERLVGTTDDDVERGV